MITRIVALGTALVLMTAGCSADPGAEAAGPAGPGTIGLAMPTETSARWVSDGGNMKKQFELLGYTTDLKYADDDIATQVSQIGEMVDGDVKALVVGAIDGSALTSVLEKAAAADIPVISYDRLIRDTPNIDYYATFDNFKVGVLQGKAIVDRLKPATAKGPFTIELFAGSPDDNNATFFFNGAMSVLRPHISSGKLVVRSGQHEFADIATLRWDGEVAKARMASILSKSYASARLDAVLSPYDGISRGILAALQAGGYGTAAKPLPVITGQDAEADSVKLIAAGRQSQTVYKDTRELAKVAVRMTDMLLRGETPPVNDTEQYHNGVKAVSTFLLQPVDVDKSNYRRILVDGGYYTAEQLSG
ncbi:multiple monosaccharide ABC transporter substrate-binding protein [Planomonospora sp. ID82291]|uniref:multiple monosaccharide ABC transporter substrate-binding protein n=1 Tax=Planomonospora sp. ID82291 TaxID=2738136 RepID=UPI0018C410EE|nr:multiple monosaccharide ABC transporter substrate-binding protein [Planomonospora sp. ID82291]MBG0816086.1 sugar-binding protein [Planomonospora sp. ID82291]